MTKPFSPACERNREPILAQLRMLLAGRRHVLEIGSGTGQHAVHFGQHLPHLTWQTSDLPENHAGIRAWIDDAQLPNVLPPLVLDMAAPVWPAATFDAVYSANTAHIMSWPQVQTMLAGVAVLLPAGGLFCLYGPFNEGGQPTSPGNAQFDAALRADSPHRGLRDLEAVRGDAAAHGLQLQADHAMPANNRLLVFLNAA
jgi:cyclopropane fatty-acyl-phospholipid synthase-like methyltransferase